MSMKSAQTVMKCIGATLAVCSAISMLGGFSSNKSCAKKTIKKTASKLADVVDTVASFM